MILYIGHKDKGAWISEEAFKLNADVEFISEDTDINNQVNVILASKDCTCMVFEAEQYLNDAEEIAEGIKKISAVNNAKAILYAPGHTGETTLIRAATSAGLKYFILGFTLSDQKDELFKCINGYYDVHKRQELAPEAVKEKSDVPEKALMPYKNIALCGASSRIGTTTQALQIIKYLILNGYKAAYIQMNDHKYVELLNEWFISEQSADDKELGKITYMNVDMFYNLSKIEKILKSGYDYYVFDYGVFKDKDFNKVSFLEKDLRIFVCGAKPNELEEAYKVIESAYYNDVSYIYSFVPAEQRGDVLELMAGKAERTFFAESTFDPFKYCNSDIYSRLLPVNDISQNAKAKKHGFIFGRKKA